MQAIQYHTTATVFKIIADIVVNFKVLNRPEFAPILVSSAAVYVKLIIEEIFQTYFKIVVLLKLKLKL